MYVYLSKILPIFLMPLSLVLLFLLVALFFLRRNKLRASVGLLVLSLVLLWTASTPFVASLFYRQIESVYPTVAVENVTVRGCIILLGGAIRLPLAPRQAIEFSESTDRVYMATQLYLAGKGSRILVTAGNQPWAQPGPSEAALIAELLVEWGVPADALFLEGKSRNTRENAVNSLPILEKLQCDRPLLVTSAAHMPRALASFQAVGIDAIPISTDIQVVDSGQLAIMDFFPDARALAMTSDAIREYMGLVVYKIRGWN